jgi:hypothetical protein
VQAGLVEVQHFAVLAQQRNAHQLESGEEELGVDEGVGVLKYLVVAHRLLVQPELAPVPAGHELSGCRLRQFVEVHGGESAVLRSGRQHPLGPVGQSDHVEVDDALGLPAEVEDGVEAVLLQVVDVDPASVLFCDCEVLALFVEVEVEVFVVGLLLVEELGLIEPLVVEVEDAGLDVLRVADAHVHQLHALLPLRVAVPTTLATSVVLLVAQVAEQVNVPDEICLFSGSVGVQVVLLALGRPAAEVVVEHDALVVADDEVGAGEGEGHDWQVEIEPAEDDLGVVV